MDKVLHQEEDFIIGIENSLIRVRSTHNRVSIEKFVKEINLVKKYAEESSIKRVLLSVGNQKLLSADYLDSFLKQVSEEELFFFYSIRLAVVPRKKHFKLFQMFISYAKTINADMEIFSTIREAKAWLLNDA